MLKAVFRKSLLEGRRILFYNIGYVTGGTGSDGWFRGQCLMECGMRKGLRDVRRQGFTGKRDAGAGGF